MNISYMLNFSLLGFIEVGFLKKYLILGTHTHMASKCISSLGQSLESNQVELGWQEGAKARLTGMPPSMVYKRFVGSCQIGIYLAGHVPPNRKLYGGTCPAK